MISSMGLQRLGFKSLTYHPDGDFRLHDDSQGDGPYISEWKSAQPQPTKAEIEAAHDEWQAEYDAKAYARAREAAYPSIGDQLDMLWHAIDDNATLKTRYADFHTAIKAVKDANPKP